MFAIIRKIRKRFSCSGASVEPVARNIAETGERRRMFGNAEAEITIAMLTDIGCRRRVNEDACHYVQPADPETLARRGTLAIVADGMGGYAGGEIASRLAVEVISRAYYDSVEAAPAALAAAFRRASREIYRTAMKDRRLRGMGTTCTALVILNGQAFCAHVGDSRLYLIRDGEIYLMTEDHSAVREMVRRGLISAAAARHHEDRNIILRALGTHPEVKIMLWDKPFQARPADQFVLCSDGLSSLVEDEEIRRAAIPAEPGAACANLIALAKERGGHDNITVGLIRLGPTDIIERLSVAVTRDLQPA
jgi:protein phosphatase